MDLRFVETLLLCIDRGGMAAAARQLRLTPAAAAQRIAALEAELQVKLLQRAGRGMVATPQCELLLPQLRQMLQLRAELHQTLAQDQLVGTLRLGAISTALDEFAARLVQQLQQRAPQVDLTLTPGASQDLFHAFEAEQLDAALIVAPPFTLPKTLCFHPVATQRLGLIRPKATDAALPFLIYSRAAWGGKACFQLQQQAFAEARVLCEMDALETIARMVEDGVGQAVVPEWGALQTRYPGLEFSPMGQSTRSVGLLTRQRDRQRPVQRMLHDILGAAPSQS